MKEELISKGFIPLDKSWIIRMGVLDMINNNKETLEFLNKQKNLGSDLLTLRNILRKKNQEIDVGESGTLYRFLQFASWKLGLNHRFVKHGTLKHRNITDDPKIINLSQKELLKLDSGTSQWASASVLMGDKERIENPPTKLALSYEAFDHWHFQRKQNLLWKPKYDKTILKQALSFIELLKTNLTSFVPEHSEDYCFARAFNLISKNEGQNKFPSIAGHESNRLKEMETCLQQASAGKEIESKDHRVIQALAMLHQTKNLQIKFKYPKSVNKSWPQFWDFLEWTCRESNPDPSTASRI